MKIMIVGLNYAPEMVGIAVYTSGMAEALQRDGHEVTVISGQPYFPSWKVFPGFSKYGYAAEGGEGGPKVIRCPHYVPETPSGLRRILHYLSFSVTALPVALWRGLRSRPDVVFVVAPSLLSAPVGWIVARLTGARTWLHIQDFEVEAAFATGVLKENSTLGWLAKKFESRALRAFGRVSSISSAMLQKLRDKKVAEQRIYELRNWANLSHITPVEGRSPMRDELGITTPYMALYSGSIANKQGIEILPEAAKLLAARDDFTMVICGEGPYLDEIKRRATGLDNVRFFPLQPLDKLSDLLGAADIHLLPQIADAATLVLPSKLTNMLASGRPVIATVNPGTVLAEEIEDCGVAVAPGNAAALARSITLLLDNPELRDRYGKAARARAMRRWDGKQIINALQDELHTLVSEDLTRPAALGRPAEGR
ncbi:WcaI family glycosyltransferase [Mangrovicoccus ximenensis]|uniref:WcaI family glycosyltransferase n=1 Tax=Mangrovicoccus ximenensis TaxID=1911570 RepID=UPI000D3A2334|nr:WcaI family glycosyltransferase [Mangrovicoccus ximenensis]